MTNRRQGAESRDLFATNYLSTKSFYSRQAQNTANNQRQKNGSRLNCAF